MKQSVKNTPRSLNLLKMTLTDGTKTPNTNNQRSLVSHTRQVSLTQQKSETDADQIIIIQLRKRIFELEHELTMKEKEITKLKLVNEYLMAQNKSKEQLISTERKTLIDMRNKFIPQQSSLQVSPRVENRKPSIIPRIQAETFTTINFRHSVMRNSAVFDGQNFQNQITNLKTSDETPVPPRSPSKTLSIITEEQFRASVVLDLNVEDDEIIHQFINNPLNKFVSSLLSDEEKFLAIIQSSGAQKMLFIYEQLKRMIQENKQLFYSLLRLKQLIKAQTLLSMANNLDEALECIIQQSVKCMGCDRASCFMLDEQNQQLWTRVAKGINGVIRISVKQGVSGFVAQSRRPLNILNAYSDPRFDPAYDKKTNYKTKTILCLPIMRSDQCLGVLQLINKLEGPFTKEDEYFGKILCEFSTVVLNRAINKDETMIAVSKLRLCVKFGIQIKRLSPQATLEDKLFLAEKALKQLMNVDGARVVKYIDGKILLLQETGVLYETKNLHCNIGQAIITKKPYLSANANESPYFTPDVDLNTNLPIVSMPVISSEGNILGAFQVPVLRGMSNLAVLAQPRVQPIDEEILEAYHQQLIEMFFDI